jgi:hypothetical protein
VSVNRLFDGDKTGLLFRQRPVAPQGFWFWIGLVEVWKRPGWGNANRGKVRVQQKRAFST